MEYNEIGSGGIIIPTQFIPRSLIYAAIIFDSGILVGGTASITGDAISTSGGVLLAGSAFVPHDILTSGGVEVGGDSVLENPIYTYRGSGVVSISGDAIEKPGFVYQSSGDVLSGGNALMHLDLYYTSTGLSDNKPPDYSGVSVGYQNDSNPTTYSVSYDTKFTFPWNVNAYVSKDYTFLWNVGRLRAYWYRVEGVEISDGCPFLNMHDGCSCRIWFNNILARTEAELCQKLSVIAPRLQIKSVKKFLKPAESTALAEDAAKGIIYECYDTEDIELCGNPACVDFCLDFDLTSSDTGEQWGFNMIVQVDAFKNYQGSGTVVTGGTASASYIQNGVNYFHTVTGGIEITGSASAIPSHYGYVGSGDIIMGGRGGLVFDTWSYTGGVWPYTTDFVNGTGTGQLTQFANDNSWLNPDFALADDAQNATVNISLGRFSKLLFIRNLGLNIPTGKNIIGVVLSVKRFSTITARDFQVYLANFDGVNYEFLSDNKAKSAIWPLAFEAETTYGSVSDNWNINLTPEDFNDPNFAIAIRVRPVATASGYAAIQYVKLKIYYEDATDQKILMGGVASTKSTNYHYRGDGDVVLSGNSRFRIGHRFKSLGRGNLGPLFAGVTTGGSYKRYYNYEGAGDVIIDGTAPTKKSYWVYTTDGGQIIMGGETPTISSNYHYTGTGPVIMGGTPRLKARYTYRGTGSIIVDGQSTNQQNYTYVGSGDVIMGGETPTISSNYHYTGTGDVIMGGIGSFPVIDTDATDIGFGMAVSDIQIQYSNNSPTTTIPPTVGKVLACECSSMPFKISFSSNIFTGNKLTQFLKRNSISLPRLSSMYYNTLANGWQHNNSFRGLGEDGSVREHWNLVFTLNCTSSLGGQDIGQRIWLFFTYVTQTNLQTYADLDSHISIAFLPTGICANQNNLFKVNLNLNTQTRQSLSTPTTTIYQSVYYDNIGLFKDSTWFNDPSLVFSISQVGIPDSLGSIPLVV